MLFSNLKITGRLGLRSESTLMRCKIKIHQKVADAYNRLGDSFFQQREYSEAVKNYQQALNLRCMMPITALYQLAFTSGLQRNKAAKISQLKNLIASFPSIEIWPMLTLNLAGHFRKMHNMLMPNGNTRP
jgi:tetratricopeptide (TPR) repeat protein